MIAVYGHGTDYETLKRLGDSYCQSCGEECSFSAVMQYRYVFLYIFGLVVFKQYFVVCDVCQRGWKLERREAKQRIKSGEFDSPYIPVLTRFGLLLFIAAFVALILMAKLGVLLTVAIVLAVIAIFVLPGVLKDMRQKGVKGYTRELVSSRSAPPMSLFDESTRPTFKRDSTIPDANLSHKKCSGCGLINWHTAIQCERCGAALKS